MDTDDSETAVSASLAALAGSSTPGDDPLTGRQNGDRRQGL
ncbi:MAG: hypothetical protein ACP5DX_05745 [Paracoccaceae bacterium]